MDFSFRRGQRVRIVSRQYTDQTQGMAEPMFKMIDREWILGPVSSTSVKIDGFYWDPRDIRPVDFKDPDPVIFKFDENLLKGVL